MLVIRERSLSGHGTVEALDYQTFVGQTDPYSQRDPNNTISNLQSLPEPAEPNSKTLDGLLKQISEQVPHQQEHCNHRSLLRVDPQNQQRHGSLDLPFPYQQEHCSQGSPLRVDPQKQQRRGSLDLPTEGFKDVILLDDDFFVTICDDYVKLYSDVGDLQDKLKLCCCPLSLSRFGQGRVVITCHSRRLCVVCIDNGTSISLELEVETMVQYSSVSYLGNNELVCVGFDEPVLHRLVYKQGFVFLSSVLSLEKFGVTVRQDISYRSVHVTSSGQIVVADRRNDYVLSLCTQGNWKIPFFYRPQAVVSDENYIYIIQGGGLNLAYRFHLNGTKPLCILRKGHGLIDPWGLSLNRNRKLMITSNSAGAPGVRVFTGLDFL